MGMLRQFRMRLVPFCLLPAPAGPALEAVTHNTGNPPAGDNMFPARNRNGSLIRQKNVSAHEVMEAQSRQIERLNPNVTLSDRWWMANQLLGPGANCGMRS